MTFRPLLHLVLSAILFAATFSPAELDAHRKWMDDAQERKDDLREALVAKDAAKLQEAAIAIEALTAREQEFWARTTLKLAQEFAVKNRGEARELIRAAQAGRFEEAAKILGSLDKTCSACHDQHFEKDPQVGAGKP